MMLPGVRTVARFSALTLGVFVLAQSPQTLALDPTRQISQYGHAVWRTQDGHLPGMPMTMAQGPDGYLWIGPLNGLIRFDGVRFTPWRAPEGERLPSDAITRLLATSDGSLWIGTQHGLSRSHDGKLRSYPTTPGGATLSIAEDRAQAIWITRTERQDSRDLVCRVSIDARFECFGAGDGLDIPDTPCCPAAFLQEPTGTTWIGSDTALTAWRDRASTVFKLPLNLGRRDMGVTALAARADGGLWVGIAKAGPGLGLQQLVDGQFEPVVIRDFDASSLRVSSLLRDRNNALWIGTYGQGLYRLYEGEIDHYESADGLSNDRINGLFEDREGSVWVATTKGIDQFRDLRVTSFAKRHGLTSDSATAIAAARDGSIWVSSAGLDVLRDGRFTSVSDGLPDGLITDLLEDRAGRLWVGVGQTLSIVEGDRTSRVRGRNGAVEIAAIASLAQDSQHDVWARSAKALFRIRGDVVVDEYPLGPDLEGRTIVADPVSGIWLGLRTGGFALFRDGKARSFPVVLPPGASVNGFVEHMTTTSSGAVLGATANGIVVLNEGKAQTLTLSNGLPCNHAHALQTDGNGNLWAYMQCGLVEIPRAEFERWWASPDARLQVRVLDALDGVDPGWAPFRGATLAPDGRLWFANGHGVQMTDPAATTRNHAAPPVHIESLVADRVGYRLDDGVQLPPLVRDLQIDYTATSFVIPQRVRFRYKLAGRDADWQEPVDRRQAFYTDLQPGDYRFSVTASNDDGVWNERGDSISFRIVPAWYQTLAFRVVAALVGLSLAWLLYRWRMHRVSSLMSARFDERLAERLRIARELHDTLLQTVQAGKLVADEALGPAVDDQRRRHALERISSWLGEAINEGRAALNALRRSTVLRNDLAEGLQEAAESFAGESGMRVRVSVAGHPREMHPIVRDEIYRIGYEAIRNAALHSRGRTLDVELTYAHDLSLRVRDDGMGVDAIDVEQGKPGHFGLQGMKERAERIEARLGVIRIAAGGTEVHLLVPGRVVFR